MIDILFLMNTSMLEISIQVLLQTELLYAYNSYDSLINLNNICYGSLVIKFALYM